MALTDDAKVGYNFNKIRYRNDQFTPITIELSEQITHAF